MRSVFCCCSGRVLYYNAIGGGNEMKAPPWLLLKGNHAALFRRAITATKWGFNFPPLLPFPFPSSVLVLELRGSPSSTREFKLCLDAKEGACV